MMTKELLLQGDCLERLKEIEDNSVDSCVTDPPYVLSKVLTIKTARAGVTHE